MVRSGAVKFLIFILLFGTFVFGKYVGGFISWFLFYSLLTLYLYIWVVSRFSLRSVMVIRNFSKPRLTAGDNIDIELVIWNRFEFPHSFILVEDDKPSKLQSAIVKQKNVVYPWFRPKSFINYTAFQAVRGIHRWQSVELVSGDIFGLVQVKKKIPLVSEVVVFPKIRHIQKWSSRNERNLGLAFSQNRISEDASSVIGVREYRRGDTFNRIHWKQSAKTMQLMTKEFERFITNDFMFIVNQEVKAYENLDQLSFEVAIELAASLVNYVAEQHFSIGIISEGATRKVSSLSRGQDHVVRILEILASAEPETTIPYPETIKSELPHLALGTTVVLITPSIDDSLFNLLIDLTARRIKVEVFFIHQSASTLDNQRAGYLQESGVKLHYISINEWQSINEAGGLRID